ncbi:phosphoesterase [Aphanothece hegewaldii CCALA 016]|uniref:Phosphoesterase n=1 Tax=Aphanothece hegewaldii CCALA 016 TaxID=2107694 RepID=A0A2T1LWL1_9CHRO|nr:CARDB domain-containing protein [Aphanothece hegewaldii]PSF36284.1 phosphoesterase [Aphanothece hegewaldii CCALA 016]
MNALNSLFGENLTSLFLDENLSVATVSSNVTEQQAKSQETSKILLVEQQPLSSPDSSVKLEEANYSVDSLSLASLTTQGQPDLIVKISSIELPDTIDFGDFGKVEVKVINKGNAIAIGDVKIKLWLSTDENIDQNDVLLTSKISKINLSADESKNISFKYQNNTSAIAPGSYYLIAKVDTKNQILERNEENNRASKLLSAPGTDVVIDWNAAALNAIQAEGEAGRGIPPTVGSRLLAILSTAIYDTVNAFQSNRNAYALDLVAPANASLSASVAGAAHQVLTTLIPKQASFLDQQLSHSLNKEINDLPANELIGEEFGRAIANRLLFLRSSDGSDNDDPYIPPTGDYIWHPKAPDFLAVGANWGKVKTFAIPSMADFSPNGMDCAPTVDPILYAQEIEEVRHFGGRNNTDLTTLTRTADQTEIAVFWAYDRADTFRPYGQLNQITEEIAIREGNSILDNARLFAALNVAIADAAIVAWEAKYKYMQPRPEDVIAGGIAANDGMASTVGDPNWQPLLNTPPFPDYISGHSIFGGAWAGVMNHFFGEDYNFTAVSQELPSVQRSFDSFYEAAYENALSRIYGGVHTREATVIDSLPTGLNIGEYVTENFFQSVG